MSPKPEHTFSRRHIVQVFAAGGSAALFARCGLAPDGTRDLPDRSDQASPDYWQQVRDQFLLPPDTVYMNAANLCPSSRPVLEAMYSATRSIDTDPSFQNRSPFGR